MKFDERLHTMFNGADRGMPPGPALSWNDTIAKARRDRKVYVAAIVTAVSVALAGAAFSAAALLREDTARPIPPAGPTPEETTSGMAPPSETPADETPAAGEVESVLRTWLRAMQNGDEDTVWNMMTPEARGIVGREEFDRMMLSELPSGLGAFADAQGFSYVVLPETDQTRLVGVISGEVTREGTTEFATAAIPMRVVEDRPLVDDPFIGRDTYWDRMAVFASESAGPFSFDEGDELIIEFADPSAIEGVWIAIDDDTAPLPTEFDSATGRATAILDRDLEAGMHIATVVVLDATGRYFPEAISFDARA